jgi:hypothetical protein
MADTISSVFFSLYCVVNLLIQSHSCIFLAADMNCVPALLLASPNDTKRITKAEQNGIEVITTLKDFLDRLKKPEEGRQETHSFVGDAEDKDPTPSSATFVDADEDYRRHLEEQRYCKQCIDHVLAQEGAQPPWVNRGCPMCGPR